MSNINPSHYKSHPSKVECIQITEHMSFCVGNATKYLWRADLKHDDGGIEDLKKAQWYLTREIEKRTAYKNHSATKMLIPKAPKKPVA